MKIFKPAIFEQFCIFMSNSLHAFHLNIYYTKYVYIILFQYKLFQSTVPTSQPVKICKVKL